jgi:hypothetical protein
VVFEREKRDGRTRTARAEMSMRGNAVVVVREVSGGSVFGLVFFWVGLEGAGEEVEVDREIVKGGGGEWAAFW